MPSRLRPTGSVAADAILVGDPGRALMLAQELLEHPRMSNHARGLWGYTGRTPGGRDLTIQATGMGGPSAALVLADLVKLGVRRAVRVGTCTSLEAEASAGELLLVTEAIARGGSATAFGVSPGAGVRPDRGLCERLRDELSGEVRGVRAGSFDAMPNVALDAGEVAAADMQTVAVLARGRELGIAVGALLIVARLGDDPVPDEIVEASAKRAGWAASSVLIST